ncbi:Arm DNA-binding domain-containing protein, partial [Ferrovum myxofaciens]|uniref:Arm DNA-binding domain-containing protein n=1 Tax=Ferrovum myxofaciens TaxID=416213 RepID=UPI000AFA24E9
MGSIRIRKESNLLFIDFYYRGVRCREQTTLKDTGPNRKRLEKVIERIETEIASGTFR